MLFQPCMTMYSFFCGKQKDKFAECYSANNKSGWGPGAVKLQKQQKVLKMCHFYYYYFFLIPILLIYFISVLLLFFLLIGKHF